MSKTEPLRSELAATLTKKETSRARRPNTPKRLR